MKVLLVAIWMLAMAWIGGISQSLPTMETEAKAPAGEVCAIVPDLYHGDLILNETVQLAGNISLAASRTSRTSEIHYLHTLKVLLRQVASCADALTRNDLRTWSTTRSQNWEVASDHYIFGLRHIII